MRAQKARNVDRRRQRPDGEEEEKGDVVIEVEQEEEDDKSVEKDRRVFGPVDLMDTVQRGHAAERRAAANDTVSTKKKAKGEKLRLPEPISLETYVCSTDVTTTLENVKRTLAVYGVAIIPSVLTADECAAFEQGMWDSLATLSSTWEKPIRKDDPDSWVGLTKLFPQHSMLLQHFGLGHAEFVWAIRQNPNVARVFGHLWDVNYKDLLVSFDGVSMHMPPETTGRGAYRDNTWFHTDQRLSDSKFRCVQGWVTALEVRPGDATLNVLLGSHAFHGEFATRFGHTRHKKDWYKLASQDELDFFIREKGCHVLSIACPAGSLVLWDSRTMHAGQESLRGRAEPNHRIVAYVCYLPHFLATAKDKEKKRKAFEEGRMTSHWPHKPILFGKSPRTYGAALPEITPLPRPTNVNALGRFYAGYKN